MDPVELHEWVKHYNWDDGLVPMWHIVESSRTEFATALMIYWLLGGADDAGSCEPGSVNRKATQLRNFVREQLLAGFYPRGECTFDPELTKTRLYKFRKAGVPEVLLLPARRSTSGSDEL